MVAIATVITALVYVFLAPLRFALWAGVGESGGVGSALALDGVAARRRARAKATGRIPRGKRRGQTEPRIIYEIVRTAVRTARHGRVEEIIVSGRVDTGDAAATCLLCGALDAATAAVCAATGAKRRGRLLPAFTGGGSRIRIDCVISFPAGRAILSAVAGLIRYAKGRLGNGQTSY